MNDKLKLSIVMPIYNAEKYLNKTLTSYCNQTYQDIEIVCVNDGSTDCSADILNGFAKKDNRIKIGEQKNSGPSAARQTGLEEAKGDYIWFVDADDNCETDAAEIIVNALKDNPADILYFGVKLIQNEYEKHPSEDYYGLKNLAKSRFGKCLELKNNAYLLFSLPRELWNKAYRREFLITNNIKFCPSISLYDDILFTTQCLLMSSNVKLIEDNLYHYHMNHSGSIMSTAYNRLDGIFYYFDKMYKFLNENSYSSYIKRNWLGKEICSMNYWLTRENINKSYYFKRLKEIYINIQKEIYELTPNNVYQLRNKNKAVEIIEKPFHKIYFK